MEEKQVIKDKLQEIENEISALNITRDSLLQR
jgi:hypothetical protein